MEIVTTSSRGQIVIPENLRKKHKITEGTRLVLLEQGDKIIMQKEDKIYDLLKQMEVEEKGWNALAETGLKEIWDNKNDDKVWKKYL